MTAPLRKEAAEDQGITAELTTADLAQGKPPLPAQPIETDPRVRPFLAEPLEQMLGERVAAEPLSFGKPLPEDKHTSPAPVSTLSDDATLIPTQELEDLRNRWSEVQTSFVDEPRKAVEQADSLVASAMKRLAEVFAEERSNLERQWDQGDSVSTEDLRVALQRYRAFFHRLLSI